MFRCMKDSMEDAEIAAEMSPCGECLCIWERLASKNEKKKSPFQSFFIDLHIIMQRLPVFEASLFG